MFCPGWRVGGAPVTMVFALISVIGTIIYCFAEFIGYRSTSTVAQHSFLGWPTMLEGVVFAVSLWILAPVERILGRKQFRNLLLYTGVAYLPLYIGSVALFRCFEDLSALFWLPYSLFVFMLLHIPATEVYLIVTDKLVITLAFATVIAIHAPYSFVAVVGAIIGNAMWSYDVIGLARCTRETLASDDGVPERLVVEERESDSEEGSVERNVAAIVEMGFNEFEAINALRRTRNNINRAVEYLLTH